MPRIDAIWRSAGSASSGQAPGSAGHQACSSCSASGVTSAPSGSHARPTSIASRLGRETSASTDSRSGATDHSSSSSRVERLHRVLADLDRAAGAERPAPGPRGDPRRRAGRPASGRRRRASRTARPASRAASSRTSRSDQRIGCSSSSSRPSARLVAGEPGGEPVVRRRAAVLERGDRLVGGLACGRRAARSPPRASGSPPDPPSRGRGRGCRVGRTRRV